MSNYYHRFHCYNTDSGGDCRYSTNTGWDVYGESSAASTSTTAYTATAGTATATGQIYVQATAEGDWTTERLYWRQNHDGKLIKQDPKELEIINKRASKLLKEWLSPAEYNYLMEQGELELPSQYEKDVIYIVKKDPHKRVQVARKIKPSCINQTFPIIEKEGCVAIDESYPDGDLLLSKILLLKTDEKRFWKTAQISEIYPPRRYVGHFEYIKRVVGTGFWFVQLNTGGQVDASHETDPMMSFAHVDHGTVQYNNNPAKNHVVVTKANQYFIWADNMDDAVVKARQMWVDANQGIKMRWAIGAPLVNCKQTTNYL